MTSCRHIGEALARIWMRMLFINAALIGQDDCDLCRVYPAGVRVQRWLCWPRCGYECELWNTRDQT